MLKGGAGAYISHFCLNHCPQIARRMMSEFKNLARLAFKNNHHTASNLGCRNSHLADVSVDKGKGA
jgi:hypothetical protein